MQGDRFVQRVELVLGESRWKWPLTDFNPTASHRWRNSEGEGGAEPRDRNGATIAPAPRNLEKLSSRPAHRDPSSRDILFAATLGATAVSTDVTPSDAARWNGALRDAALPHAPLRDVNLSDGAPASSCSGLVPSVRGLKPALGADATGHEWRCLGVLQDASPRAPSGGFQPPNAQTAPGVLKVLRVSPVDSMGQIRGRESSADPPHFRRVCQGGRVA